MANVVRCVKVRRAVRDHPGVDVLVGGLVARGLKPVRVGADEALLGLGEVLGDEHVESVSAGRDFVGNPVQDSDLIGVAGVEAGRVTRVDAGGNASPFAPLQFRRCIVSRGERAVDSADGFEPSLARVLHGRRSGRGCVRQRPERGLRCARIRARAVVRRLSGRAGRLSWSVSQQTRQPRDEVACLSASPAPHTVRIERFGLQLTQKVRVVQLGSRGRHHRGYVQRMRKRSRHPRVPGKVPTHDKAVCCPADAVR